MLEYNTKVLFGADKIAHFSTYAVIALCIGIVIISITSTTYRLRGLAFIWFILVLVGIVEEYRQFLLPDRTAELWDAVANILGVSTGMLVPLLFSIKKEALPVARYFVIFFIILFPLFLGLAEINERHVIVEPGDVAGHDDSGSGSEVSQGVRPFVPVGRGDGFFVPVNKNLGH